MQNKRKSFSIFSQYFKSSYFILLFVFFISSFFFAYKVLAIDGVMNGKTITGATDNYLFWLQTYDKSTSPYYFDKFFINKEGGVGVGKINPTQALDVFGGAQFSDKVYGSSPGGSQTLALTTVEYVNAVAGGAVSGVGLWNKDGNNIYNANTANVGIGTNSPSQKLDVTGSIALSGLEIMRLPNQSTLTGSLIYGTGGSSLVNTTSADGRYNTLIGIDAGSSLTTATANTALGHKAGEKSTTGSFWTAIGREAGQNNTTGNNWVALGSQAGQNNTTGSHWTAIGPLAGNANTIGDSWISVGTGAGNSNVTGSEWIAIGYSAARFNTGGEKWVGVGAGAGYASTTGGEWTAIGNRAGFSNTTGNRWTALGYLAAQNNTTGGFWTAVGGGAAFFNSTGSNWTALGVQSGFGNTSGSNWTAVGYSAGEYLANGTTRASSFNNSVYIGANTKVGVNGASNENVFGYDAIGSGSNSVTLGNDSILKTILKGSVGIGVASPSQKLDVSGGAQFSDRVYGVTPGDSQTLALTTVEYVNTVAAGAVPGVGLWTKNGNDIYNSNIGNVGIGTNSPSSLVTIANNNWISAINSAGSGAINMFKLNANNQIEVGAPLLIGPLEFAANSGLVSFLDMPITASSPSGTPHGYAMKIDGNNIITSYAESNGSGGINNARVGIGTATPGAKLEISGEMNPALKLTSSSSSAYNVTLQALWNASHQMSLSVQGAEILGRYAANTALMTGNVGIGKTNPTYKLDVVGGARFTMLADGISPGEGQTSALTTVGYVNSLNASKLSISGGTMTGDLNMGTTHNIVGVNKITAATVDPLYRINGINYSTFAPSVVGGVKEEYTGRLEIAKKNTNDEYEAIIDFSKQVKGSDLWVFRRVVDYGPENIEVLISPQGSFANTYYKIEGEKIIIRADRPVNVSYRLTAKRHDWRNWPTKAIDQEETPSFVID